MRKLMVLVLAVLVVGMMVPAICGAVDLVNGEGEVVGEVTVDVSGVEVQLDEPWCLKDVHIDVQEDFNNFPTNKGGNPKLQAFAYKAEFPFEENCITSDPYSVSIAAGDYIAVHVGIVNKVNEDTNGDLVVDENDWIHESAWGQGDPFSGNVVNNYKDKTASNWAMYFQYVVE